MPGDEEMKDTEWREDEDRRNTGLSPPIEEESQESSLVVEAVLSSAESLDPNPERPKDDENDDGDTTIATDEIPNGHLPQEQPTTSLSSSVGRYDRQEAGRGVEHSGTSGPMDFPTFSNRENKCSYNGTDFNNSYYPTSSPSNTSIPFGFEDRDLALAVQLSFEQQKQERERRTNDEQDRIRGNHAMSITRCRICDPYGVPDWDDVDFEDLENFR